MDYFLAEPEKEMDMLASARITEELYDTHAVMYFQA